MQEFLSSADQRKKDLQEERAIGFWIGWLTMLLSFIAIYLITKYK